MRDQLLEIVKVVSVLPFEVIKVTGTDGEVALSSLLRSDSFGSVVFTGKLKKPLADFDGVFGLTNIGMLSGLLGLEAFNDKDAKVSMKHLERNGVKLPEEIVFEKDGFGKASYRLAGEKQIPQQAKLVADLEWDVTVAQPEKKKINDFAQVASIYSAQESKFSVKTDKKNLKMFIGDEVSATNKAQVVFADNVEGTLKATHKWSTVGLLSVLKLGNAADLTVKFSNQGLLQVDVDTGIGVYSYIFAGSN